MTLSASIKHHAPGRLRLQFSNSDFEGQELRETIQSLRRSPAVLRVQGNALTRTVLIEADSEDRLQSALKGVAQVQILKNNSEEAPSKPLSLGQYLAKFGEQADLFLKDSSEGRIDLRTGMMIVFAGLGLKQIAKGSVLPAGMTLLLYAAGFMDPRADAQQSR